MKLISGTRSQERRVGAVSGKVLFMNLCDGPMSDLGGVYMDYFVLHGHFSVCMFYIYKTLFFKKNWVKRQDGKT